MFWVVLLTTLLFSSIATVIAGNWGVSLPLLPICAFYFTAKVAPWKPLPALLIAAALLDAVWLREIPGLLLAVALVAGFTAWWRHFGDLGAWTSLEAAALYLGFVAWLSNTIVTRGEGGGTAILFGMGFQFLLALVLTPLYAWGLEKLLARRIHTALRETGEEE